LNPDPRKKADAKSRGIGLLVLLGGIAVTGLIRHWAADEGRYDMKAAVVGPLMIVLGIGFLVHGAEIPLDGIRPLTRIYGIAGSLAGILNLYLLGFFERVHRSEAALPDRFYGGPGHVPERAADASIEPR
jgi:hypothetical protein